MERKEFQEAVAAARRGDRASARRLMREVLLHDPNNISAWVWMSGLVDDVQQQKDCLDRALKLDPHNQAAREALNVLSLREFLATLHEPVQVDSKIEPQRIGDYLVQRGYISKQQLEAAVMEQLQRKNDGYEYQMVGDILVQRGWLTPRALATVLVEQQMQKEKVQHTAQGPQRLGEYLVKAVLITPDQLAFLLAEQARRRYAGEYILLGELLVSNGYLTPRQLEQVLEMQFKDYMTREPDEPTQEPDQQLPAE